MKLYTSPLACSMATRIVLAELGRTADIIQIDAKTRRAPDGSIVHPMGMVPVLHTDDGRVLTENAAILQFVAHETPLVPSTIWERAQLQQWLSFIGTELHKAVFVPLLDPDAPEGARAYALEHAGPRLAVLEQHLATREYLLAEFSIADAYLATVLNWAQATPVRLADFPAVAAYLGRIQQREAVARCLALETQAYLAQRA